MSGNTSKDSRVTWAARTEKDLQLSLETQIQVTEPSYRWFRLQSQVTDGSGITQDSSRRSKNNKKTRIESPIKFDSSTSVSILGSVFPRIDFKDPPAATLFGNDTACHFEG